MRTLKIFSVMQTSAIVATIASLTSTGAAAQTSAPATSETAPAEEDEIVVTARKQDESIQSVPLSIKAFSSAEIARAGITSIADIARRAPNLTFGDFGDIKLSPTSIRGVVSSSGSAGADPAAGYYVDEVFVGQGAGASVDLYDIERVEVLRGPQGTLFGRNTLAGAISITTTKPSDEFSASVTGNYGNYDYKRLGAAVSGPIVPGVVQAKISGIYNKRDGISFNEIRNEDANTLNSWTVRGALNFILSPDTTLLISGDHQRVDQSPLAFEVLRYNSNPNVGTNSFLQTTLGIPLNRDPFDRVVQSSIRNVETLNATNVTATFKTKIGSIDITSITSHHFHRYFSEDDTGRGAVRLLTDGDPERVTRDSQELRAAISTDRVDVITGLYLYRQKSENQSFVKIGPDLAALFGDPALAGIVTGSNGTLITKSIAGFTNVNVRVSDSIEITAGARYTRDQKSIDYTQSDPIALLGGNVAIKASDSWTSFTPSVTARYRVSPDFMTYATISTGFKSGGFNDALGDATGIAFKPEKLTNYELGFKGQVANRLITYDAAVFYMDWTNVQVSQIVPPRFNPTITNGGRAYSLGIEVNTTIRPVEGLTLGVSGALLRSRFNNNVRRGPTAFAPEYTANISAEYRFPETSLGQFSVFGEMLARGKTYLIPPTGNTIDLDGRVSPYALFNLRASLSAPNERWKISIWGKNLTDKTYKTRVFDLFNVPPIGEKLIQLNEPRTYGVEVKFSY